MKNSYVVATTKYVPYFSIIPIETRISVALVGKAISSRPEGPGSSFVCETPPCTLMAPGACKIRRGCNVEVCTGPRLARGPYPTQPAGWAGPADEREFFQRAGPGRQMKDDFSYGPGRAGT